MKWNKANSRKLRYGGVTAILTALIIAVILIVNVIFSALAQKLVWYSDLTPELLFTLSDNCVDLLKNGDPTFENSTSIISRIDEDRAAKRAEDPDFEDEDLMVELIFCDDPDKWEASEYTRYVYETARQLEAEFPDYIRIKNVDIVWNPSAVSKYGSSIQKTSVIVTYGAQYRVRALDSFYLYNTEGGGEKPWAYTGEKVLASSILAVTRTDAPIACITTNHREDWDSGNGAELLNVLDLAGYKVQRLDLAQEEIPAQCRLIVVFNPYDDFKEEDGLSDIDEIVKLDAFLDKANALMVFQSPEAGRLEVFESYLAEWGISFDRKQEGNTYHSHIIQDTTQSLSVSNAGFTFKADYYTQGLGGQVTEELRARSASYPTVAFKNAMSISYSDQFSPAHYTDEEDSSISFDYGTANVDGYTRSIYDVFVTSAGAVATANGQVVERATANNPLKLMTISRENHSVQENNLFTSEDAAYVMACGSAEFAYNTALGNESYGNGAYLEYALRHMGQEPVPVGLTMKPFGDYTIDSITTKEATQYTVVLTVVPAVLAMGAGIFVIVRRKYR